MSYLTKYDMVKGIQTALERGGWNISQDTISKLFPNPVRGRAKNSVLWQLYCNRQKTSYVVKQLKKRGAEVSQEEMIIRLPSESASAFLTVSSETETAAMSPITDDCSLLQLAARLSPEDPGDMIGDVCPYCGYREEGKLVVWEYSNCPQCGESLCGGMSRHQDDRLFQDGSS